MRARLYNISNMDDQTPQPRDNEHEQTSANSGSESDNTSLSDLLRKVSHPIRPQVLAYLFALLFVCIVGLCETRYVEVSKDTIAPGDFSHIPLHRQAFMPDFDSLRWVVYTQDSWESGSWYRLLHWTYSDNFPNGRFVGWSSPPMWWLEILAGIRHYCTGEEMSVAIAEVAPYYNVWLYVFAAAALGLLFVKALGWKGAFVVPMISLFAFQGIYGAFSCDYHLWMLLAGAGTIICLSKPFIDAEKTNAAAWFVAGALFCSLGIWICAPSQALVVIGIFIGLCFAPEKGVRGVDPANWRLFGYVTSLASLLTYWWEFGSAIPMNVELNGPVYAGGLFVAGIWMWQIHGFILDGRRWRAFDGRWLVYSALGLLFLVVPLVVYLPYCFSMADAYGIRWGMLVPERQPIQLVSFFKENILTIVLPAIFSVAGLVINRKKFAVGAFVAVSFLLGCIFVTGYLGVSSFRFFIFTETCLAILFVMALPDERNDIAGWLLASVLILNGFCVVHDKNVTNRNTQLYRMPPYFTRYLEAENVSDRMLKADKGVKRGVLAPVDEACIINYYSDYPVLGTGYWENQPMLIETLRIFYYEKNPGDDNWTYPRSMIESHHLSHIIIPKNIDYLRSYTIYGNRRIVDGRNTFAFYLINVDKARLVPWLRLDYDCGSYRLFTLVDARQ